MKVGKGILSFSVILSVYLYFWYEQVLKGVLNISNSEHQKLVMWFWKGIWLKNLRDG